jgi:hypothetical protein
MWLGGTPSIALHDLHDVQVHDYKRIPDPEGFFTAVQAMQPPLQKIVIDRVTVHGSKVAARIAPLVQLRSLELLSCYPPRIPASLTALTRLKLENAPVYCYPDATTSFTEDLSVFSALQVNLPDLVLCNVIITCLHIHLF